MAVTIRLQRAGTRNRPFFHVVVADSRKPRDGAFIERLGHYDPLPDPEVISIDAARLRDWIGKGARPSDAVRTLLRRMEKRAAAGVGEQSPKTSRRPVRPAVAAEPAAAAESAPEPEAPPDAPALSD